jgi:hypothetical protein
VEPTSALFISHSSADNAAAELQTWLQARGHNALWLDFAPQAGGAAGRDWERELYRNLRACQAAIVLCSQRSTASAWVFAEIALARALGKQLFPVQCARSSKAAPRARRPRSERCGVTWMGPLVRCRATSPSGPS